MKAWRPLRLARHPVISGARLVQRLAVGPGLPLGGVAQTRRLLRTAIGDRRRALVIGDPGVVRQALPDADVDVVGTSADRGDITVVSEANGADSLPRRWDCVVVTEVNAPHERLLAAAHACLPGGILAVVLPRSARSVPIPGTRVERVLTARKAQLVMSRVTT
jgi:hypothetical protein